MKRERLLDVAALVIGALLALVWVLRPLVRVCWRLAREEQGRAATERYLVEVGKATRPRPRTAEQQRADLARLGCVPVEHPLRHQFMHDSEHPGLCCAVLAGGVCGEGQDDPIHGWRPRSAV